MVVVVVVMGRESPTSAHIHTFPNSSPIFFLIADSSEVTPDLSTTVSTEANYEVLQETRDCFTCWLGGVGVGGTP